MTDDATQPQLNPIPEGQEEGAADSAAPKSDAHPVFGSGVQPQEIYHEKIVGAPDPSQPAQSAAKDTAGTHPVFGSGVQPQDVYDEKIVGAPDPNETSD